MIDCKEMNISSLCDKISEVVEKLSVYSICISHIYQSSKSEIYKLFKIKINQILKFIESVQIA